MAPSKEDLARRVFGERAAAYVTSKTHRDPEVLAHLVELSHAQPSFCVLDVATGTGHTALAFAPHVAEVVAIDLTPEMLAQAEALRSQRGADNVRFEVADVHALPYDDGSFDLIVSRRAPHHFSDIARALGDMRRVLRSGGRLLIDDRSVPEDDAIDTLMNRLDVLHDESHVRQYRPSEWRRMLEALSFRIDAVEPYEQHRPIGSLTDNVAPDRAAEIHRLLDALPEPQRTALDLRFVDGVLHLRHFYVTIAATRDGEMG